ncbi:MAG: radical SAM protein [Pyrinomonadaceae bacterium]|nr:radical SAM protein [Pyrinomonadaceae bacterium]
MSAVNVTSGDYGHRRLTIELTNICNLHCSYCLRDDDALYHTPANFLAAEFLSRIVSEARQVMGITHLVFTGGEPTLHPEFAGLMEIAQSNELLLSFVTNGWHFERIWPTVVAHRRSITHVSFSLDGVTRETHDHWRGDGSFVRVVRAVARCRASRIPFAFKMGLRRDTIPNLEQIAIFAGRMGATLLSFGHVLPTSTSVEDASSLSLEERRLAEQEIAALSRIFKMKIGIDVGYYNVDVSSPCSALAGVSANIDYRGRLSLCCNLSGFRGAVGEGDVVADLHTEDFGSAFARLSQVAAGQLEARRERLTTLASEGREADLYTGSPCLFCLDTLGKLPWRQATASVGVGSRSLPVLHG